MKPSVLSILLFLPLLNACGKDSDSDKDETGTDSGETGTDSGDPTIDEIQSMAFSSPSNGSFFAPGDVIQPTVDIAGNYLVDNLTVALRVDADIIDEYDFQAGSLQFDYTVGVGTQVAVLEITDDFTTHQAEISWIGNTAPVVVLDELGEINQGQDIVITGQVSDGESEPSELTMTWFFDGAEYGPAQADANGNLSLAFGPAPSGSHIIELVVEDEWETVTASVAMDAECTLSSSIQTLLHLNESSGEPQDSSLNAVSAEIVGNAVREAGVDGNALNLGGESYIAMLDSAYPPLWATNFTIAGWVKPNAAATSNETIFQQLDGTGLARTMLYRDPNCGGALNSYIGAATLCASSSLQEGVWQHVAITRNRDTGKVALYYNGVKEAEGDRFMEYADGGLVVGVGKTLSTQFFDGAVDDVVVLSEALEETQVLDLYNGSAPICDPQCSDLPSEPYHWYDGSAGTGSAIDLLDLMGNSNALLVDNANFGDGTQGNGLLLDGVSAYAEIEAGGSLQLSSTDFTISLRARYDGTSFSGADHTLIQQLDGNGLGRTLVYVDASCGGQVSSFIGGQELCSGNLYPGLWHHIALRVNQNDGTAQFYLDGVAMQVANRTMAESDGGIRIGAGKTLIGQFWNGAIDDILVFNTALTDAEILSLHESGTNYCPIE